MEVIYENMKILLEKFSIKVFLGLPPGFLPWQSWYREWRTRGTFPSGHFCYVKIQYWKICCDLKIIALLMGMDLGYTKFRCFLCEWDRRYKENHDIQMERPKRVFTAGQKSVVQLSLVDSDMILLPPLHIKLGLYKCIVKAMDTNADGFHYSKETFPGVGDAIIKEGIFVGHHIRAFTRSVTRSGKISGKDIKKCYA